MSRDDLLDYLNSLNISRAEAAQLLGVTKRTVNRWAEGEEIPGPVQAALRAWRSLNERHLAWKPDSISIIENDTDQIERVKAYAVKFEEKLKRVEARGGPTHLWKVDFENATAKFGASEITFYKLANGGFSLGSYRRTDRLPNLDSDAELIEDAAYCISKTFEKLGAQATALIDVAEYVRKHSASFARDGRSQLTPKQVSQQKSEIERLADELNELAEWARGGHASYRRYEEIQGKLHAVGFFPKDSLVAAVARAFV
jgi:hypothetical protein